MIQELTPSQLRRACDPASFAFQSTVELPVVPDIIGQPRATRAIEFGIDIASPGFNIFVLGPGGTGRATTIQRFLEQKTAAGPKPNDWVYVNNFAEPYKPRAIALPPGQGREMRADMQSFVAHLQVDMPRAFETEEYEEARTRIEREFEEARDAEFAKLNQLAQGRGFALGQTPTGLLIAPVINGKPADPEAIAQLPAEQQEQLEATRRDLEDALTDALRAVRERDKAAKAKLLDLDRRVAGFAAGHLLDDLEKRYADFDEVVLYLKEIRHDIIEHAQDWKESTESSSEEGTPQPVSLLPQPDGAAPSPLARYQVNLLVDNSRRKGAPVIVESNPTFTNLLGRIEHDVRLGGAITDFMMLRAGALHAANGGYLVLRAKDLLDDEGAYNALKRAVGSGTITIEEPGAQMRLLTTTTLEPEPIPLDVKVILVGSPSLYYALYSMDEDFQQLFKVKADFAADMERTPENEQSYALFIRARVAEEDLREFSPHGVAAIVEYGSRLAEDQTKLTTHFGDVADIIREASYWAGKAGHELVSAEDVYRAVDEWTFRSNQIEERVQETIADGTIMIDTQGAAVGQVNGLSVSTLGDYSFGEPSRITARTFMGRAGVVAIEREVKMSGRIHNKGVLILAGYLGGQYALERPLTLSASLSFEQMYNEVDGDSASSTELYAILSSLSGLPIKQSIAVTGSVNQRGQVQPIGGAQHKIEGFFRVCKARGLTGDQGVVIPHQNAKDLMLRPEVVEACAEGKFHIWAVQTIDEGIELLTGVPAGQRDESGRFPEGTVHARVEARLKELAEGIEKFAKGGGKKEGEEARGTESTPNSDERTPQ
jgi:lon-related putative ATP-dependent protease